LRADQGAVSDVRRRLAQRAIRQEARHFARQFVECFSRVRLHSVRNLRNLRNLSARLAAARGKNGKPV
jgi:hypothetical protein